MKALYISPLASNRLLEKIQKQSGINPGYASAKFHRLIINGLLSNLVDTHSLATIPANQNCKQKIWIYHSEVENDIYYNYVPVVNIPIIKHICILLYSFFYILIWGAFRKKDRFIILDVLNISLCVSAIAACRITGVRTVGIVTDMPGLMVEASDNEKNKSSKISSVYLYINKKYLNNFDCYVFLTEQMNNVINHKNRPYIVMEGLVDSNIAPTNTKCDSSNLRSILYAGGLHERYGLKTLVEAFRKTECANYRLILYGSGPYVQEIIEHSKRDNRIEYRGVVPNNEVLQAEKQATLLVNPRPTDEEFTKYSFPSKNMEYMSVGRPLLTTKLPGMPEEYYNYVYIFEDETINGFVSTIKELLSKPEIELSKKGEDAQRWVLKEKNNIVQSKRILGLVKSVIGKRTLSMMI